MYNDYSSYKIQEEMYHLEDRYLREKDRIYRTYDPSYSRYYSDYASYRPAWNANYSYLNSDSSLMTSTTATNTKETTPVSTKKYIIIGTSGAAIHPTEHSTLEAAEKEADRLSTNKPGEEFTIFATTKSYKIEKPKPVVKTFV